MPSPLGRDLAAWAGWRLVALELAAWRRDGKRPVIWWRDDDARRPSGALTRLLELSRDYRAPLALAVIPDQEPGRLRDALALAPAATVIQHGCDHVDRNQGGGYSAEFAPETPASEVAARITSSWDRLSQGLSATPVYAPPWNQLTPNVVAALPLTPLRAVSTYGGDAQPVGCLERINAHIDVMKWRPARFRGDATLLVRFWRHLRARRLGRRWGEPIGWLTHHAGLDEDAWAFLAMLLRRLGPSNPQVCWASVDKLAGL